MPDNNLNLETIDREKPDWVIHRIANGKICQFCGKVEYPFAPYICNTHTHGLDKYDGHPEFQVILDYGDRETCYILNELGCRVRAGARYQTGDLVDLVFEDCPVRLDTFVDDEDNPLLRVIIPDSQNRWPEDPECDPVYARQILPLGMLRNGAARHIHKKKRGSDKTCG